MAGHPVRLRFRNAGTCFNLNSLVLGQDEDLVANPEGQARFVALGAAVVWTNRAVRNLPALARIMRERHVALVDAQNPQSYLLGMAAAVLETAVRTRGKAPAVEVTVSVKQSGVPEDFMVELPVSVLPAKSSKPLVKWLRTGDEAAVSFRLQAPPARVEVARQAAVLRVAPSFVCRHEGISTAKSIRAFIASSLCARRGLF